MQLFILVYISFAQKVEVEPIFLHENSICHLELKLYSLWRTVGVCYKGVLTKAQILMHQFKKERQVDNKAP